MGEQTSTKALREVFHAEKGEKNVTSTKSPLEKKGDFTRHEKRKRENRRREGELTEKPSRQETASSSLSAQPADADQTPYGKKISTSRWAKKRTADRCPKDEKNKEPPANRLDGAGGESANGRCLERRKSRGGENTSQIRPGAVQGG